MKIPLAADLAMVYALTNSFTIFRANVYLNTFNAFDADY